MARGNKYVCATCGRVYEYCSLCNIVRPSYDAETFCSAKHNKIFAILSKHGCNLITAEEALKELSAYNLDEIPLTESILTHIEKIKSEVGVNVEETIVVEEPVVAEKTVTTEGISTFKFNKKNKKKW